MDNDNRIDIDQLLKGTSAQPAKPRKVKWWMIAIPVVLVIVIAVACLWQPIVFALHPEQKLAVAMGKTLSALSQRYDQSPVHLLGVLDPGKPSRMELDLVYADTYTDTTELSFDVSTDPKNRQIMMALSVEPIGDMALYIDPQGFAAAHNSFDDAKFYGVTYETFRADLMKSVLGPMLQQEPDTIDQLEKVVQSLQKTMNLKTEDADYFAPYAKILADFAATIEVSSDTSSTLSFSLTMEQLMTLCNQIVDTLEKDENWKELYTSSSVLSEYASLTWEEWVQELRDGLKNMDEELDMKLHYTFYVGKDTIVTGVDCKMELKTDEENSDALISLQLGSDPAKDDLVLTLDVNTEDEKSQVVLKSSLLASKDEYCHTISCEAQTDGVSVGSLQLKTQWHSVTGALKLHYWMKDGYREISRDTEMNLKLDGRGFVLTYAYEGDMGELFNPGNFADNEGKLYVTLRYKERPEIEKPEWINLDQWDEQLMQDLQEFIMGYMTPTPIDS